MTEDSFLQDVIDINPLNINEHFQKVPAELAYYNQKYADAVEEYLVAKHTCERAYATAFNHYSNGSEAANGRKPTVASIEANVQLDDDYHIAKMVLINAESEKQHLRGKVDVVSAKKEMLISLGAHIRVEMGDPMIRSQARNMRETENGY